MCLSQVTLVYHYVALGTASDLLGGVWHCGHMGGVSIYLTSTCALLFSHFFISDRQKNTVVSCYGDEENVHVYLLSVEVTNIEHLCTECKKQNKHQMIASVTLHRVWAERCTVSSESIQTP